MCLITVIITEVSSIRAFEIMKIFSVKDVVHDTIRGIFGLLHAASTSASTPGATNPINWPKVNERSNWGVDNSTFNGTWTKELFVAPPTCSATSATRRIDGNWGVVVKFRGMSGLASGIRTHSVNDRVGIEMEGFFRWSRIDGEIGQNFPILRSELMTEPHETELDKVL
jgi:hypothetical protein